MNSFYSKQELAELGLKKYGDNVLISRKASIYGAENMSFGDNVRIDDFCVLTGRISIGNYVHISAGVLLCGGQAGISFGDYSTISSRGCVYAQSDDYSGAHMTNPMVPERYTGVYQAPVIIGRHVIIGTGSTLLPGVTVAEGCALGAMSLLNRSTEPWGIYYGVPARREAERDKALLALCREFERENQEKSE